MRTSSRRGDLLTCLVGAWSSMLLQLSRAGRKSGAKVHDWIFRKNFKRCKVHDWIFTYLAVFKLKRLTAVVSK